jgi:hypothetical protein
MNLNPGLQNLAEQIGENLGKQAIIINVFWSIVAVFALVFIIRKFTKWDFLVSTVVTIFSSILAMFIGSILYAPIKIIMQICNAKTIVMRTSFAIKLLSLSFFLTIGAAVGALSYLLSLKIICYFSKEGTYKFGRKFFLITFAIFSLPAIFVPLHFIIFSIACRV